MKVHGYEPCTNIRCEKLVSVDVRKVTQGLCSDCWIEAGAPRRAKIEALLDQRPTPMSLKAANTRRNKRKYLKRHNRPDVRAKDNERDKAKRRAQRRLAMLYPTDYAMLLAEERAAAGMDPWPESAAIAMRRACDALGIDPSETLRVLDAYHLPNAEPEDVSEAG